MANDLSASAQPASLAAAAAAAPAAPPLARAVAPASLSALTPILQQVRSQPKLAWILGAALAATALVALLLIGHTPDYKVLYANVSDHDGGAIIGSLQQMNVPYKFSEGGGAILVPADKVSETRLKLAAQGLPKAGGVGFELLDDQKFGTSQFAEQVNYQRGLEGELARSIESIGAVQSARVHLALPKSTLFVREQKQPTASVLLTLYPGRTLDDGQVSAIVHLVSSSVPDMQDKSVTVVDQRGNLLSAANAGQRGLDTSQLKYVESIEQSYVRRIENILHPMLGAGNVRAQVAADVDFTVVEGTEEKYRPNQDTAGSAIRSQQTSESSQDGGMGLGGVPGALTNQAPATPTAPLGTASGPVKPASAGAAAGRPRSTRRDVTTNYEVDHSVRHTQEASGQTRRVSVAVVVNNREVRDPKGRVSMVPLTAAELDQVTRLVKEAVGFNQSRGDSVNVVNTPFTVETLPQVRVPPWKDPQNVELAKSAAQYCLAALAMILVFLALRRGKRKPQAGELVPAALRSDAQAVLEGQVPLQLSKSEQELALEAEQARRTADIEFAKQTALKDPQLVASLVRHWLTT